MDKEEITIIEEMDGIIQEALEHPGEKMNVSSDILKLAIDIEQMTREHYSYLSQKVANSTGKTMFEYLVSEEDKQIEMLNVQAESLKKNGKWVLDEDLGEIESVCPLVNPEKDVKVSADVLPEDAEVSRDASDMDVLKLAIEVKKRCIKFYCTAEAKVTDELGKKMFAHLIKAQEGHLKELEVQYAWLDQAGFWYDHNMMSD
jgi:rubrerythrin